MTNDIKYLVNENEGVVTCILGNCSNIPVIRIKKYMGNQFSVKNKQRYRINDTYSGVARCASEDTFDVEVGKKIALTKAKQKRAKAINKALNVFTKDIGIVKVNTKRYGLSNY